MKRAGAWLLMPLIVIGVWQLSMYAGLVSPAVLATPLETLRAVPRILSPSQNLGDLWSTVIYSSLAFALSVPSGVVAGVAVFGVGKAGRPWEFLLDFLRSVPATALVPVFLIIFGINNNTKLMVGAFSSALVVAMATMAGLTTRNRTRIGVAQLYGLSWREQLFYVEVPEILPHIFVGLKAGISLALILVVVTEMLIGGDRGLGRVISDMRYTDDKPRLYAAIALTGVIGYLYNLGIRSFESRVVHWKGY
jgi:ABC-type nitrate/sulfonate/bicarbonate transport system permease component